MLLQLKIYSFVSFVVVLIVTHTFHRALEQDCIASVCEVWLNSFYQRHIKTQCTLFISISIYSSIFILSISRNSRNFKKSKKLISIIHFSMNEIKDRFWFEFSDLWLLLFMCLLVRVYIWYPMPREGVVPKCTQHPTRVSIMSLTKAGRANNT